MIHPLVNNLDKLNEKELYEKIQELTNKFYQTSNLYLQEQVICVLDCYKDELTRRKLQPKENIELDHLIKVN